MECLTNLGYVIRNDEVVQGYRGVENADFAVQTRSGYGIGFRKNARGAYDIIADWWGVKGTRERNLLAQIQNEVGRIQKEYTEKTVMEEVANEGFDVVERCEDENGTIRIVVRRWK